MAKSLRSKWKRKMKAVKRVRYGEKEATRLANMLEKGKERRAELEAGVIVRTASDIRQKSTNFYPPLEERMETPIATSEHNHRTLKNKDGNFPKWMSKTKVDKHKKVIKKKKAVKKLAQKKAKV